MVKKLVVISIEGFQETPRLENVPGLAPVIVRDQEALAAELPDCEILLGWQLASKELENVWHKAKKLKWIHWCCAGVDGVIFPALAQSHVQLTNARGMFDRAMAEYVLGYMLSEVKDFRTTIAHQQQRVWRPRLSGTLVGGQVMIFGVGSIGREIARVLNFMGMTVHGVGRTARPGDAEFAVIHDAHGALEAVRDMDWVIGVMPLTDQTRDYFGPDFFRAMKTGARFINVGRGLSVDETALEKALRNGPLAAAMLDVTRAEPLPSGSPLWNLPNLFISPHMSGDSDSYSEALIAQFLQNFERYQAGLPLLNTVDLKLGFAAP